MIKFELKHKRATYEMLGFIPSFLSESNPEPAAKQLNQNYAHGGGWSPSGAGKWTLSEAGLKYPGDPALRLIAEAKLREEVIRLYENAWVVIIQPSGAFEVSRMD